MKKELEDPIETLDPHLRNEFLRANAKYKSLKPRYDEEGIGIFYVDEIVPYADLKFKIISQDIVGHVYIVTVKRASDFQEGPNPIPLFETLLVSKIIDSSELDGLKGFFPCAYSTKKEALVGHAKMFNRIGALGLMLLDKNLEGKGK